jgi:hypothetical protein
MKYITRHDTVIKFLTTSSETGRSIRKYASQALVQYSTMMHALGEAPGECMMLK